MNPQPQIIPGKQRQETIYISFSGNITTDSVANIINTITNVLGQFDLDNLCFLFSSPGGNVRDGITLYNFLCSIHPKIIMYNTGSIDSIANVIFLAGVERYAYPHTSFLFHGVKNTFLANTSLSLNDIQEYESSLKTDQAKIAGIIAEKSSYSKEEIVNMYNSGKSIDTEMALDKGIITSVSTVSIGKDDVLITMSGR